MEYRICEIAAVNYQRGKFNRINNSIEIGTVFDQKVSKFFQIIDGKKHPAVKAEFYLAANNSADYLGRWASYKYPLFAKIAFHYDEDQSAIYDLITEMRPDAVRRAIEKRDLHLKLVPLMKKKHGVKLF